MFVSYRQRVLIVLAFFFILLPPAVQARPTGAPGNHPAGGCDFDRTSCVKVLEKNGLTARLDITPKPLCALKRLTFTVYLQQGPAPVTDANVTLHLSMPGMYMPENISKLKHQSGGKYEGHGILVRCSSGSRIWEAEVRVERAGNPARGTLHIPFTIRLR